MFLGAWILLLVIAIVVVGSVVACLYYKRKLYRELALGFGVPPYNHRSFYPAESYWQAYTATLAPEEKSGLVDDLTWNNLDMDQVYMRVNACRSEAGDIRLYSSLRACGEDIAALERRADLFQRLEGRDAVRLDLQYILSRIGRHNTGTVQTLTLDAGYLDVRYRWLVLVLALLPFLFFALIFVNLQVGTLLLVASLVVNFISSHIFKSRVTSYNVVFPLATAITGGKKLADKLEKIDGERAGKVRSCAARLRIFALPLFIMSHSSALTEGMMFPDFWGLFQLPLLSYYRVARSLVGRSEDVAALYRELGEVDLACAVLSYRAGLTGWTPPAFHEEKTLAAVDLCHPLLAEPVPNTIEMDRSVLLTGSNASGKSTFIKAVALNCILAQSILTCTASRFALCRGGVVSAMAIADNIFEGDSYFVAEVKALRRMLRTVTGAGFHYLFIDEILRGTNTIERIGASGAFLHYIAEANCLCIAATHDIELVTIVKDRYDLYHFSETVHDKLVDFTYQLQPGPVQTRNALLLLESHDFPPEIVQKAREAVGGFEGSGQWK